MKKLKIILALQVIMTAMILFALVRLPTTNTKTKEEIENEVIEKIEHDLDSISHGVDSITSIDSARKWLRDRYGLHRYRDTTEHDKRDSSIRESE